jgi:hypothetical protein
MSASCALKPAAAASLALWHEMVSLQDLGAEMGARLAAYKVNNQQ